ncbi:DUF2207 domain-containing protein, partial [Streptomonospora salina]
MESTTTGTRTGGPAGTPSAVRAAAASLAAAALAGMWTVPPAAAGTGDTAETERAITDFAADVTVAEDGAVRVREELTYRLGEGAGGPVERWVPHSGAIDGQERSFGLTDLVVADAAGVGPVETESGDGADVARIGSDRDIELTGEKTFVFTYTYETLLTEGPEGRPRLFQDIVGSGWEIPVESARARVHTPGTVDSADCYAGEPSSTASCRRADSQGGDASFASGRIDPGQAFSIDLGLGAGAVDVPAPAPAPQEAGGGGSGDSEAGSDALRERVMLIVLIVGPAVFALLAVSSYRTRGSGGGRGVGGVGGGAAGGGAGGGGAGGGGGGGGGAGGGGG